MFVLYIEYRKTKLVKLKIGFLRSLKIKKKKKRRSQQETAGE